MVKRETAATGSLTGECGFTGWLCKAGSGLLTVEPPILHTALDPKEGGLVFSSTDQRLDGLPAFEVGRSLQQKLFPIRALPLDFHRTMNADEFACSFPAAATLPNNHWIIGWILFSQARGQLDVQFILVHALEDFLETIDKIGSSDIFVGGVEEEI